MKNKAAKRKGKQIDWEAVCERTRQRCNKLSKEELHRLEAEALRIIYGADAKAAAHSR